MYNQQKNNIRLLFSAIGRYKLLFLVSLLCLCLAVTFETGGYLLLRYTIDDVIIKKNVHRPLYLLALIFLMIALIRGLFSFFAGRGSAYTAEHVPELNRIFFAFLINFIAVFLLEWRLALSSIIILPALAWISFSFFKKIFTAYDAYQDQEASMSSMIQENLNCIRVVRAFARQEWEINKFDRINTEQLKKGKNLLLQHAAYWPVSHLLCGAQLVIVINFKQ